MLLRIPNFPSKILAIIINFSRKKFQYSPCNFPNSFRWNGRYRDDRSGRCFLISNRPPPSLSRIHRRLIVRWCMWFAISGLLDEHRFSIGGLYSSHSHAESCLLCARNMKRGIAIALVALYASTGASPFAYTTSESPACCGNAFNTVNGLKEHGVSKTDLGDPKGADHVGPGGWTIGLLKCSTSIWTENTVHCSWRTLQASSAEPLALGYVRHTWNNWT